MLDYYYLPKMVCPVGWELCNMLPNHLCVLFLLFRIVIITDFNWYSGKLCHRNRWLHVHRLEYFSQVWLQTQCARTALKLSFESLIKERKSTNTTVASGESKFVIFSKVFRELLLYLIVVILLVMSPQYSLRTQLFSFSFLLRAQALREFVREAGEGGQVQM